MRPPPSQPIAETPWYSDEALRKQAEADRLKAAGEIVPLELLLGILEPRTPPEQHERCRHCRSDARDEAGGSESKGARWCDLCLSRGRDEEYRRPSSDSALSAPTSAEVPDV